VLNIARIAGDAILKVYRTDFDVYFKEDMSPLTKADKWAHDIIQNGLDNLTPSIPILSEEGVNIAYEERLAWERYWLVDPLDGTKEFVNKNDEFTINIALMENTLPIFGIVYAPALDQMYWGRSNVASYKIVNNGSSKQILVKSQTINPIQIAVSRSHQSDKINKFISQFDEYNLIHMGSSLKICYVSDGSVHFYPRLGPTMEWDTAASHAIIKGAGGELIKHGTNKPICYNKENLRNPEFIAGNFDLIRSLR